MCNCLTGRINKSGYIIYKSDERDCNNCPFKDKCTKNKYKKFALHHSA